MRVALPLAVAVALAVACLSAPVSLADRATAEYYSQRGEKALRERDFTVAQEHFHKALLEDPKYAPAHGGLGEAFLGAGDRGAGIAALREAVAVAESTTPMPPAWGSLLARLRKRLAEVDTAGVALDRIADKYVADLLAYADRWLAKDPDAAAVAVRDVLRVKPGHAKAKTLEGKLAKAEAAAWVPLFNGRDRTGWDWLDSREWWLTEGDLVGDVPNVGMTAKTAAKFHGDFDVRVEAKIVKRYSNLASITLLAPWTSDDVHASFGMLDQALIWSEDLGATKNKTLLSILPSAVKPPFDPLEWTVYEMRFRGDQAIAVVNGNVVGTFPRLKERSGGAIGLNIQHVKASFRRVEVRLR